MAKKDKAPETKIEETSLDGMIALTPEQFVEIQGGGMQTVMSIGLAERLYLEDRQDRILYLDGEVDDDVLHTLIMQIAKINGEDCGKPIEHRTPITLIINSGGGNAIVGMALINAIQSSNTPVIGVCLGICASMAFGIFAVCHTRLSVPDATFMVHDGYECQSLTTATKAKDWSKFSPRLENRYYKAIASRTKFTVKELEEICPHDNWYFADDLVDMGMVDAIIGRDVALEDIFSFMSDVPCECNDDECNCCKEQG